MNRLVMMVLKNIHIVPGAWFKLCHYGKHTEKYPEQEKWDHIKFIMGRALASANVDMKVTGLENIPAAGSGGFMMYANHQGLFDVVAIAGTCPTPLGIAYKKELANVPVLKQIFQCTKSFALDREDVRQSLTVIQAITKEVEEGRNYIIFPEGTRSKNGNVMGEFHGGSFRCATKSKCPVLPIALIDSYKVLDQKGSGPVKMQLHYLPVIAYEEYKDMKPAELAELVRTRIEAKIRECE